MSGSTFRVDSEWAGIGLSNNPVGDIKGQPDDAQLTRSRLSTQLLERRSQRVEFGAEIGPIPGLS